MHGKHPHETDAVPPPQIPADPGSTTRGGSGRTFWRSLDEVARTEEFHRWLADEFPDDVRQRMSGSSRREFLKMMAATFALGGAVSCSRRPMEQIAPYVNEPGRITPGEALFFASAVTRGGYALGTLTESRTGRPTKIEGNPRHPASLGATDIFAQAELLTLYDPSRSQAVYQGRDIGTWSDFQQAMRDGVDRLRRTGGRGLRLLTGTVTSPTLSSQIHQLLQEMPQARWHQYDPARGDHAARGGRLAFHQPAEVTYHFKEAGVILSLDNDFLFAEPGAVRYAREFADRRRARTGEHYSFKPERMNRLYVVEPSISLTGANADHRLAMPGMEIGRFARGLASRLGMSGVGGEGAFSEHERVFLEVAAEDLQQQGEHAMVLAGEAQPPEIQALVLAINEKLGSLGTTVKPVEPIAGGAERAEPLEPLVRDMARGEVEQLVILNRNPCYDTPRDLRFGEHLKKVALSAHLGLYRNETGLATTWHVPAAHELEAWSDARAHDGTAAIIQPLIEPLWHGRSAHEILLTLQGRSLVEPRELVRGYWRGQKGFRDSQQFESWWRATLARGVVEGTRAAELQTSLDREAISRALEEAAPPPSAGSAAGGDSSLELVLKPDPTIWDGTYANNGWLQELPKPNTMLTWDNAVLLNPDTAKAIGVQTGSMVRLRVRGGQLKAAVWLMPGQHERVAVLSLGYGRTAAGPVGSGQGFNAYRLRTTEAMWHVPGLEIEPLGWTYPLATTQNHHLMEGRDLYRKGDLEEFKREPHQIAHHETSPRTPRATILPEYQYTGNQWGMSIDLSTCIGCGACTAACQAENNIPVVGKEEVINGREMHWIRVDRYFAEPLVDPGVAHQPVPCMHCEKAPCELVCPVAATKHSHDGLNEMIYNRCIGTRFCSNNCPYKVRRFNFFDWNENLNRDEDSPLDMIKNPEVTVRGRGVMEKCTYCVQRIRNTEITAKNENRPIYDGEIVTACQQVCPTEAIKFGDINDEQTEISREKAQPHDYAMLEHLNTQPRTTYLAAVGNPNPKLEKRKPAVQGREKRGTMFTAPGKRLELEQYPGARGGEGP